MCPFQITLLDFRLRNKFNFMLIFNTQPLMIFVSLWFVYSICVPVRNLRALKESIGFLRSTCELIVFYLPVNYHELVDSLLFVNSNVSYRQISCHISHYVMLYMMTGCRYLMESFLTHLV